MLRSTSLLCDMARAIDIPTTIAAPNPISAERNVEISAPTRLSRFSIHASTTSVGAGSRKRGTSSARQMICHDTMKMTKTRIGGPAAFTQRAIRDGSGRATADALVVDAVERRSMVVASSVLLGQIGR